jgi:ankyrin repeat protein
VNAFDRLVAEVKAGAATGVSELLAREPHLARAAGDHDKTGLHWAAETNQAASAAALLDAGADIEARTDWGATPLQWAAVMGSTAVAELLLARVAGGYTLAVAAAIGHLAEVRKMVERDHLPGAALGEAMHGAARNGHTESVDYLLDRGADVNSRGFFEAPALHWAAINGHAETVSLLMARGADLALRDARFDATAEGWAIEGGHDRIAAALRAAGAS